MRAKLLSITVSFLMMFCSTTTFAENHHTKSHGFKVMNIKNGFYFLQGKGGNILVSDGTDGLLIVDADYFDMSKGLEKTLETFGKDLKYILNTHWHGDHTQGNKSLGHHATIIAHDNVHKRLSTKQEVKLFNMVSEPYPAHALPDITYSDTLSLHFNGHKIKVLHLAGGHTDGDSVIFYEADNLIHLGDLFFNGFFPFVDVDAGGNVKRMAANLTQLLDTVIKEDTVIIPGHGPLAKKADLVAFRDMLIGTSAEVEAMMKESELEAIQAKGLSGKWEAWTKGFLNEATWIKIVYDSLKSE